MDTRSLDEDFKGRDSLSHPLVKYQTRRIDGSLIRFIDPNTNDEIDEPLFTIKDIYVKIGIKDPASASRKFIERNKHKYAEYIRKVRIQTTGGPQETYAGTKELISIICMRSNTPMAIDFQKRVAKLLTMLDNKEAILIPTHEISQKSLTNPVIAKHSFMLEQHENTIRFYGQELKQMRDYLRDALEDIEILKSEEITTRQAENVQILIHQIARLSAKLEGKPRPESKHFKLTYSNFKRTFNINKYSHLPKKSYRKGISWLNSHKIKLENELKFRRVYS